MFKIQSIIGKRLDRWLDNQPNMEKEYVVLISNHAQAVYKQKWAAQKYEDLKLHKTYVEKAHKKHIEYGTYEPFA
eukprot:4931781-Karenia_brevis.AAC.1